MRKRRRFYRGVVNHIYQKTSSGHNIFYGYEDFLMFFTIMSVSVRSSDIQIFSLCLMYNHFHSLARTEVVQQLSGLMNHCCSWFAREFNHSTGRSGQLFRKNFGSAPKRDEKAVRNAINYIGNNPVEKRICGRPEQYRWNFLAYAVSANPFSEPLIIKKASNRLRKAVKEVKYMSKLNLPLKSRHILRLFKGLSDRETEQLVDLIITEYNFIEYEAAASYYDSFSKMVEAMAFNTGSEYDIREEWNPDSDLAYQEMQDYVRNIMKLNPVSKVISLPSAEKFEIAKRLLAHTDSTPQQVIRFLHLSVADKSLITR